MIKDILHQKIVKNYNTVQDWFDKKSKNLNFPFYSSFDLRDSSVKITPVDANLFPAGFNNICEVDKQSTIQLCKSYLNTYFPNTKNIILLAEEHTNNPFYWDNIYTLKKLIEKSDTFSVFVCVPGKNIKEDIILKSANGHSIEVSLLKNQIAQSQLIISNNDFSVDYQLDLPIAITPPIAAGWNKRRKHSFFNEYNQLAKEFSELIHLDHDYLNIKTKRFTNFQVNDPECLKRLTEEVSVFLSELEITYKKIYKEKQKPFIFLKNNSGTYGLGMTSINTATDIENWNYKIKKKMKATKGGGTVTELIIQEGIASHLKQEGSVAEPVLYLVGPQLAGGFLRTHREKGVTENLNSPGAVYRTLCISDLEIEIEGKPMENVYGWIAHLGVLALASELQSENPE